MAEAGSFPSLPLSTMIHMGFLPHLDGSLPSPPREVLNAVGAPVSNPDFATCLAEYMTDEEVHDGIIYPPISRIRDITKEVAAAVITEAIEEDLAEGYREIGARELQKLNQDEIRNFVHNNMWKPEYAKLVYKVD